MTTSAINALDLDLDVFSGPFDLLLALILREEVDLLELALADVVLAYLDHLHARGELDLETTTEFVVLIAALLELKSKLMLLGEHDEEDLLELEPEQAAHELLARMLDARRYRAAAGHLRSLLEGQHGFRFRQAPPPAHLRRMQPQPQEGSQDPAILGEAIGRLLALPPRISLHHIGGVRVTVAERLSPSAQPVARRHVQLRRRRPRRRPHDGRRHPVRAARALQARRSRVAPVRELRRDLDQPLRAAICGCRGGARMSAVRT